MSSLCRGLAGALDMWTASIASAGLQALCGVGAPASGAAYLVAALLTLLPPPPPPGARR